MNALKHLRYKVVSKRRPELDLNLYEIKMPEFEHTQNYELSQDGFSPCEVTDDRFLPCEPVSDLDMFSCMTQSQASSDVLFQMKPVSDLNVLKTLDSSRVLNTPKFKKMRKEAEVDDIDLGLLYLPQITENLFKPLLNIESSGKCFDGGGERKHKNIFRKEINEFERKARGNRKSYWKHREGNTITSKHQTIWDLILPTLQPPLNFNLPHEIGVPSKPYPYQVKGIEKLLSNKSFLLADEMGTGKTVMSVLSLRILFQKGEVSHALILCPLSAISVWDSHLSDWASHLSVTVVRGNREMREADWANDAHVYLTTYDTLRNDFSEKTKLISDNRLQRINHIILDEAQYVKNPVSGRSKAVRKLNSTWKWALTGTPIENRLEELVSIFDFLKPKYLDVSPLTAKKAKEMIEPFFLRRKKQDVIKDLPPKIRQNEWLNLEGKQKTIYDNIEATGRKDILKKGKDVTRMHIFALMQALKQICNFVPGELRGAKVDALIDHVEAIAEGGNKVLVFSQYRQEGIDKLCKILENYGVVKYEAKMSVSKRQETIEQFRQDPEKHVFLSTVKTAGLSLTLTEASYVIHFDQWWNPAVAWQAEDRAHRMGQKQAVNIYSYWVNNTIEERIYNILERKGLLFKEVIDGLRDQDIENMMTMEDLLDIIGIKDKAKFKLQGKEKKAEPEIDNALADLKALSASEFERVIKELLGKLGFKQLQTEEKLSERILISACRDTLGDEENLIVQLEKTEDILGIETAQELEKTVSSYQHVSKGFLITSGFVNNECRNFCNQQGQLNCIDGAELANYIQQFDIKY